MLRLLLAVTVILVLSGCLNASEGGDLTGIEEVPSSSTLPWIAAWHGDLLMRLDVQTDVGVACLVDYEFSGKGVERGAFFHAVVQDATGAPMAWNSDSEFADSEPSADLMLGGQEVIASDPVGYDYWSASGNSSYEAHDGVLTITFAARNLDFWPEEREGYIFAGPDPQDQANRTAFVEVSCDADFAVSQLSITSELIFFDTFSFDGVGRIGIWTESADEAIMSGVVAGTYGVETAAKDVVMLATIDSAPSVGRLTLAHPTGHNSWTFDPTVNAFELAPVAFVKSTAGSYEFTLDWGSSRNGRIMGFLGAV